MAGLGPAIHGDHRVRPGDGGLIGIVLRALSLL